MNKKYGVLLVEGTDEIDKFQVVAIPRDNMLSVISKLSSIEYTDQSGQSEKVPVAWANGWSVEWFETSETNANRTAIKNAMDVYNAKYVNKLTIDQLILNISPPK